MFACKPILHAAELHEHTLPVRIAIILTLLSINGLHPKKAIVSVRLCRKSKDIMCTCRALHARGTPSNRRKQLTVFSASLQVGNCHMQLSTLYLALGFRDKAIRNYMIALERCEALLT